MTRALILVPVGICLAALGAGYLGAAHPAGDSLAVFRPLLAAGVLGGALALYAAGARRLALICGGVAVLALGPVLWASLALQAAPSGRTYSLYQKNMLFRLSDPAAVAADISARAPDFLTLQEVSRPNRAILPVLAADYPSRHACNFAMIGGVAVLSRWPVIPGTLRCAEYDGMAAMRVRTPDGPLWVVSLHLHWPWPYDQAAHVARLLPKLEALEGPKVIGGDFNMVPWSNAVRQIRAATGAEQIGPLLYSFPMLDGWLRLPIDHVLATGQGSAELLPLLGSDHYGVLARFSLDP